MKIKSILIANRGEIAVRIINTAKKMGIITYVILTKKEPNALHIKLADEVIDFTDDVSDLPEFLDIERIIDAAVEHKIDAIHPGYGFLAENAYFASRCKNNNIIFIGPSDDSIYKMGNKTFARKTAEKLGVPLPKGINQNCKNAEEALEIAKGIGFPVILKATSGGGGKGMRVVYEEKEFAKMYKMASSEAEKSFNDASLYMEKFIEKPRHVEMQVAADQHGNIVYLGERECSIQRRHQKLLEESPSTIVSEELRKKLGEWSVKLCEAVNYYSLGTVEFLVDSSGNCYFMEMNTRIQVEHPVTEEITGIDLVELQIRIAQGEKLPLKQSDVKLNGWAMEFRINAEDVQMNFSPNIGIIEKMEFPKMEGVRIDTGYQSGDNMPGEYDSMVAKLIVHAKDRETLIQMSDKILSKVYIKGIKTTIPFFKALLNEEDFKKSDFDTSFIEDKMSKLYYQEDKEEMLAAYVAMCHYMNEIKDTEGHHIENTDNSEISSWLMSKRIKN